MHKEIQIIKWAEDRGILTKATPKTQYQKLLEEVYELGQALVDNNQDDIIDAIGDIHVVMTILAYQLNLNTEGCIDSAYDVISKRTGKMENGFFVKDK